MPSSSAQSDTDINAARTLQPGIPLSGSLPTWTDRNFFALNIQAAMSYAVSVTPLTTSIFNFTLVDRAGADATRTVGGFDVPSPMAPIPPGIYASIFVAPGPVGQADVPFVVPFTALTTETVFAEVSATYFGPVSTDQAAPPTPYTIQLGPPDDYGDTPATAGQLAIGGSVSGEFDGPNDKDQFMVMLEAGKTYEFDTPTNHQLSMMLQSTDLQHDVAQWNWYDPPFIYTPDITGPHYLTLSTWLDSGSYTISANLVSPTQTTPTQTAPTDTGNLPATTAAITMHRMFDTHSGAHLITASSGEADELLASQSGWMSEDAGFDAVSNQSPGAQPVFRFFDTANGSHFLTISAAERDSILNGQPNLTFEGVGFYGYAAAQDQTTPVYRYFDAADGTHFYTSSASEIAAIASTRPDLHSEGVAFYAPDA